MTEPSNLRDAAEVPDDAELVEAMAVAADAMLVAFNGGLVKVPNAKNRRGYTIYFRPQAAMQAALKAIIIPLIEADRAAVEAATIAKVVAWLRAKKAAMFCQSDSAAEQLGITADDLEAGEWKQ